MSHWLSRYQLGLQDLRGLLNEQDNILIDEDERGHVRAWLIESSELRRKTLRYS